LSAVEECVLCAALAKSGRHVGPSALSPLYSEIADYEYAVPRSSKYYECGSCGFVMQVPKVTASEIPSLYPDDYQAYSRKEKSLFGAAKARVVSNDARKLLRLAGVPEPRILEVGCGNGSLLRRVLELNPKAYVCGIDIKDLGLSADPQIDFRLGQLEAVDLPDNSFDAIYCSNLIEHVAHPLDFIVRLKALLRPGGKVVIVTPNHRSIDRYVFGRYWGGYHFPRHLTLFNHKNIKPAIELGGLRVERISGSYAWWAISVANCLFPESARRPRGPLFMAITAVFLPFDMLVNLFRPHGSMTAIAQKPV
jgi:SAM-dependent methyltransferase